MALIASQWCPDRSRLGHRHRDHPEDARRRWHLQAKDGAKEKTSLVILGPQTSGLQHHEKVHFCFCPPVCGIGYSDPSRPICSQPLSITGWSVHQPLDPPDPMTIVSS